MTKRLETVVVTLAIALAAPPFATAQEKEKPAAAAAPKASAATVMPLKLQITIARYQGEKKISSMPYTLSMNAGAQPPNNTANLRMGTKMPVMMVTAVDIKQPDGKQVPQIGPIQYQDVGTNIDCRATALDDGRFLLQITVDDSSVYPDEQAPGGSKGNPAFRSFRASNTMVLRNSETGQFTTAADKVTGEVVKVDVTLTVVK
jgi:Bacterial type II and III secretion system protein